MKRTSIRQTTRNFTIILAGLMLCVSSLSAQTATRQRLVQADASPQEPQQKPKPNSNVDPLGILNTPEPPKPNPPAGQTPATNKPNPTPQTPKGTTYSSSLDTVLSSNGIVASWVPGNGASIPPNAVVAGNENGAPLYACRFRDKQNWVMLGKVVGEGCNYGLGKEKVSKQFEVLVGGGSWRQPTNSFAGALDAGPDYSGEPRYLCRAPYQGGLQPGRLLNSGCYISYGGKAFSVPEYEVFYSSAGALASNGSSRTAANQRSTEMFSSPDLMPGGSSTTLSVAIRSKRSWVLDPTVWGWLNGIMTDSNIFHLIDLNGGQLESGDLVNFRHQNTGQPVVIKQGQKERNLALGEGGSEAATFKLLKVVNDKIESKGVIRNEDIFAIQASDGEYVKVTMVNPRQKLEASEKIGGGESYRLMVFQDDTTARAAGQASVAKAEERAQKDQARQERINDFMRGVERGAEQIKSDAEQERIRQAQEARQVAAQKVAAREAAARGAEAQQQLDTFRHIEAEAKKQRDEQAAREAEQQVALSIAPKLLIPAPDGVMNNGCYNFAAVTRTYSWTAVPLATTYQLYVISPRSTVPNLDVQVADTSYTEKSTGYSPEGSRFGITWKVRAMINGQWGAWSEERTFSYAPVNANPACRK